ncbi:MAG: RsmB/NOP family class I SAM-dependent RNA methyltransferase [Tabrizicola sp.]|jgi:16S rRNA (cytosine967-C5)-methyltransferase|nr:RsmB/NOP family class I SAM-dependent RNA methyltransferase [Tabrizicola sp.]
MTPGARLAAAIAVLDRVLAGDPTEKALTNWGRASRYAGSKDRAAVRDIVYDALRRKRSAAARGGSLTGRGLVLGLMREAGQEELFSGEGHAPAPAAAGEAGRDPEAADSLDMPDWLVPALTASLGEKCSAVCAALRQRAPVFLRVNLAKAGPAEAMAVLAREGIETALHPLAQTAVVVTGNARKVQTSEAYLTGLVELQDAASQAVVEMLDLRDGLRVLDYCAGGGGKTLAMAARARMMVFAHDAWPRRMADLPERARRAGISVTLTDRPQTYAPFDLVLVDAPCSGSGSWRRDPEGKWALTPERLAEVMATQAAILEQASGLVGETGTLAYATCSLLHAENAGQIAAFLSGHSGWRLERERTFLPMDGGDGFYCAILKRR